jgi:hypothetical protein
VVRRTRIVFIGIVHVERNVLRRAGVAPTNVEDKRRRDGMGWDGMGWMGWDGMGWDGMGWDGISYIASCYCFFTFFMILPLGSGVTAFVSPFLDCRLLCRRCFACSWVLFFCRKSAVVPFPAGSTVLDFVALGS